MPLVLPKHASDANKSKTVGRSGGSTTSVHASDSKASVHMSDSKTSVQSSDSKASAHSKAATQSADSKKFALVDSKGEGTESLARLRDAIQILDRDVPRYANDPFVVRIVCDIIDLISGKISPVSSLTVSASSISFWNRSSQMSSDNLLKFWIDMLVTGAEDSEENPWRGSSDDKDDPGQSLRPRTERDLRMGPRTWNGAFAFFERLGDILSQVAGPVRTRLLSSVGSQLASILESNRYLKGQEWAEKFQVLWCRAAYALLCLRGVMHGSEPWEPNDMNEELKEAPWRMGVPEVAPDSQTRHALWAHSPCIHLRSDVRWLLEWKIALRETSSQIRQTEAKKKGEEAYRAVHEALEKLGEEATKRGEHWHVLLDEMPGVSHLTGFARYSRIFVRIQDVGDQIRKKRFMAGKKRAQKNMTEFETRKAAAVTEAVERKAAQDWAIADGKAPAPVRNVIPVGYSSWSERAMSWHELSLLRDDGPATEPEPIIDPPTGRRRRAHGYDSLKSRLMAGGRRRLLFALVIEISHLGDRLPSRQTYSSTRGMRCLVHPLGMATG